MGFSGASSGGDAQYIEYCNYVGKSLSIDESLKLFFMIGVYGDISKGIESISFTVQNVFLKFSSKIVDADIPSLI